MGGSTLPPTAPCKMMPIATTLCAMGALEIRLLGGFQLRRDGKTLPPIPTRPARSVMAYLVLNRDRAHTRDLLIGTFWPDMPETRGRRRLSQALWQIRSTVGDEGCIVTNGDAVRFETSADARVELEAHAGAARVLVHHGRTEAAWVDARLVFAPGTGAELAARGAAQWEVTADAT